MSEPCPSSYSTSSASERNCWDSVTRRCLFRSARHATTAIATVPSQQRAAPMLAVPTCCESPRHGADAMVMACPPRTSELVTREERQRASLPMHGGGAPPASEAKKGRRQPCAAASCNSHSWLYCTLRRYKKSPARHTRSVTVRTTGSASPPPAEAEPIPGHRRVSRASPSRTQAGAGSRP